MNAEALTATLRRIAAAGFIAVFAAFGTAACDDSADEADEVDVEEDAEENGSDY